MAVGSISNARAVYVVAMFTVVAMLSQADQFSFSILLEPIRRDLGVSDTAMGMVVGAAASMVFAVAGIPIARLADVGNRRNLLAGATAVWSLATGFCGFVTSFAQLMAARIGVSAAEAAVQPSFVSMVADIFTPARRGIAIAAVMMGGSAGVVLGSIAASAVSARYGWHFAFLVLGAPGIVVGFLFWLTVPEPRRGANDDAGAASIETATTLAAVRYLLSVPTAWRLILANTMFVTCQAAMRAWLPTFFVRVHGLTMSQMGRSFGLIIGLSAMLSMAISALLSDRLAKRGERWRIRYIAGSLVLAVPVITAATLIDNISAVWSLIVLFQLLWAGAPAVVSAAGVGVIQPRARALWVSLYYFLGSTIGGLCGPLMVGFLSDRFAHRYGQMGLRYSMLTIPVVLLPAAVLYFWSSFSADEDARRVTGHESIFRQTE